MSFNPVLVVGSANLDMVFACPRFPKSGETLMGKGFQTHPGGKGANQAVAIGKLGGQAAFCGCVGDDAFGNLLKDSLSEATVAVGHLYRSANAPSGTACILVDESGANVIIVAPGANWELTPDQVASAVESVKPKVVLCQLEIPLDAIEAAAASAPIFILNPAPARELPDSLLAQCTILTPNETELATLTGQSPATIDETVAAARTLIDRGVETVIVTLGSRGSLLVTADSHQHFPAHSVDAVDTVAAGDAFNGALAHYIAQGEGLESAITAANSVAALSTTKPGAQESMPTRAELEDFLRR